jgi:Cu2+-exporting ATPase
MALESFMTASIDSVEASHLKMMDRGHSNRPCTHCGLSTPVSPKCSIDQPVFCCQGCKGAYELIHGWGLEDFYSLRDSMAITGSAASAGLQARYEQYDQEEFLGESAPRQLSDGSMSAELGLQGLHCAACSWLIEKAMSRQPGIRASRVKMSDHTIQLTFDPTRTRMSAIAQTLDRLGYQLLPLDRSRDNHLRDENRRLLIQIAIAGFLAANAMWIAVALYAGQFTGVAEEHKYFFGLVGIVLGAAAVIGPGRTFFIGAMAALRTRTPHMDMPIALGLSVGTVAGVWHAISGSGPIYFDCLATLVFLLLIGRWIQFRQQHRAARAVELMLRITPRHAELIGSSGESTTVLVERLQCGDRIRVGAGDQIAADGIVIEGESRLNKSLLTGESQPVAVRPGDRVEAGTVNVGSPLVIEVGAVGAASRIGQVMQSVELAAAQRTPIVQLADRIGGVFVVVVMLLALLTFLRWLPTSFHDATNYATALLIVACPCALALATPLAIAVGIGRAAKSQILVRDGMALQQLSQPGMLWLDKTGTLTEGRQRARMVWGDAYAFLLAASVERQCQHPIAQAITAAAEEIDMADVGLVPENVELASGGVSGIVCNSKVLVGNQAFMQAWGIELPEFLQAMVDQLLAGRETPIFVACQGETVARETVARETVARETVARETAFTGNLGRAAGSNALAIRCLIGLSDPIREHAAGVVTRVKAMGWTVGMLSGDHPEIARAVARAVGIEQSICFGDVSPEQKLAAIKKSQSNYPTVVMVGDGANDAAALAAADVGIAVRGGAEVSLHAAPVFMASQRLTHLLQLFKGSRTTTRVIALNFGVSFAYNLLTVVAAWSGWISPLMAAVLMPLSSATVLGLTFLVPSFGEIRIPEAPQVDGIKK